MTNFEMKALEFAERYGIASYTVVEDKMYYKEYFGNEEYEATVDLNTMKETRKQVK